MMEKLQSSLSTEIWTGRSLFKPLTELPNWFPSPSSLLHWFKSRITTAILPGKLKALEAQVSTQSIQRRSQNTMMEKGRNRNSPTTLDRNWYSSNEMKSTESCANTNPSWPHHSKTSKAQTFITNTRSTLVTTSLSRETPTQCPHTRKDGLNAKSQKCSSLALSPAPKAHGHSLLWLLPRKPLMESQHRVSVSTSSH